MLSNEEATCVVSTFRKIVTILAHPLGSEVHLVGDLGARTEERRGVRWAKMGVITQHRSAGRLTAHIIRGARRWASKIVHGTAELKPSQLGLDGALVPFQRQQHWPVSAADDLSARLVLTFPALLAQVKAQEPIPRRMANGRVSHSRTGPAEMCLTVVRSSNTSQHKSCSADGGELNLWTRAPGALGFCFSPRERYMVSSIGGLNSRLKPQKGAFHS